MRIGATLRILGGVVLGLVLGTAAGPGSRLIPVSQLIGGLWLDALRMTTMPLIFGLIVTGIGRAARQADAAVTRRALAWFVALLAISAMVGLIVGSLLFARWNMGAALPRPTEVVPTLPPVAETLRALIPANPIGAAAQGAILPLVVFALFFGFALKYVDERRALAIDELLDGVVDAMLVIVRWVLLAAPLGVFALAFAIAARTGFALGAALGWYVAVQIIAEFVLVLLVYTAVTASGRTSLRRFARAAAPAQMVGFTTQSSLASLPAMLEGARALDLPAAQSAVVLPTAVALFRIAAPASITIVTLALAHINGVTLGGVELVIVAALAVVNTLTIAGLPNQITFFAAYAPPALAVGVPIELLPLMLAVDAIPDMFYTLSNVTADLGSSVLITRERRP